MKHVFTDPQALLAELSKEMLSAMQEVDEKGKAKAMPNSFIVKEAQRDTNVQINIAMHQIAQVLKVEVVMYRQKYI